MEVSIYQLSNQPFSKAFPKLLETITGRDMRIMVWCKDAESLKKCDNLLWGFEQLSFLPHQLKGDFCLLPQNIYITDQFTDNPHNASVLAFYDISLDLPSSGFSRAVYMLSPEEAYAAKDIKTSLQQKNIPYSFFEQQADNSWMRR